jgi:3-methylfumaryl-CoA hydratase
MSAESFLNAEIMATVGEVSDARHGLVTANHIAKFCVGIDHLDPVFFDRKAAQAAGYPDIIAPPLFNAAVTRPVPPRVGFLPDGQYDNVAPPGLNHLQTMLAGQSWELIRPSVVGEEIIETFRTKSITERQGKTGNIVFVEKEAEITTLSGEVIERYSNTLILRNPPPPLPAFTSSGESAAAPEDLAPTIITPDGLTKNPDMISLFMFVAAIWGIHRIHWDIPYAQSEGLRLPILPGWMFSSYLAQFASLQAPYKMRLNRFAVRYKSSAYPGDNLQATAGLATDEGLPLVLKNQDGGEVATAVATYLPR